MSLESKNIQLSAVFSLQVLIERRFGGFFRSENYGTFPVTSRTLLVLSNLRGKRTKTSNDGNQRVGGTMEFPSSVGASFWMMNFHHRVLVDGFFFFFHPVSV